MCRISTRPISILITRPRQYSRALRLVRPGSGRLPGRAGGCRPGAGVSLGGRFRGRRAVRRGRSAASGAAGRLRRRDRRADRARARAHAAVRPDHVHVDRPVRRARRLRHRPERHRGHAGAPRGAVADDSLLRVSRSAHRARPPTRRASARSRICAAAGSRRSAARWRTRCCCAPSASTASRRCRTTTTCIRTAIWCSAASMRCCSTTCSPSARCGRMPGFAMQPDAVAVGHYVGILAPDQTRPARSVRRHPARGDAGRHARSASSGSGASGTTTSRSSTRGCWRGEAVAPDVGVDGAGGGDRTRWTARPRFAMGGDTPLLAVAAVGASVMTLVLSCLSMALAVALGILIATGRVYGGRMRARRCSPRTSR